MGGMPFAGIAMCDQDDAWGESRHFSERNMAELYTEEPAPSPKQRKGPRGVAVARKTTMASLDLADQVDEA